MLVKLLKRRAHAKVNLRVRTTLDEVHPVAGPGMFNYRCYYNAAQYQSIHGGQVIEVIYIEDDDPTLHYINKVGEEYRETSLGMFIAPEYYQVRVVDPSEYPRIDSTFNRGLRYWTGYATNWFTRLIIKRAV